MAVFTKNLKKNIFVHPGDQNKLPTAIKNALLEDKKKYSDSLAGALLDVSNIQVIGERYLIVNGYLSMEVIADFEVFSPTVGMTLDGVINKVHRKHYGCLVMNLFNASLSVPEDSNLQPQEGDNCSFVVTKLIVDGDLLFMRGQVTSVTHVDSTTCLQNNQETSLIGTTAAFLNGNTSIMMENDELSSPQKNQCSDDILNRHEEMKCEDEMESCENKVTEKSPKKHKKKRKSEKEDGNFAEQRPDVLSEGTINIKQEQEETNDSFLSQKVKSPKKHKKKRKSEDVEISTSFSEQHNTLEPSGHALFIKKEPESDDLLQTTKSPKKHKKKRKSEDEISNSFSQHSSLEPSGGALFIKKEPETPKKHKKKKEYTKDHELPSSFFEPSGVATYIKQEPETDYLSPNQKKSHKKKRKSESFDHV